MQECTHLPRGGRYSAGSRLSHQGRERSAPANLESLLLIWSYRLLTGIDSLVCSSIRLASVLLFIKVRDAERKTLVAFFFISGSENEAGAPVTVNTTAEYEHNKVRRGNFSSPVMVIRLFLTESPPLNYISMR